MKTRRDLQPPQEPRGVRNRPLRRGFKYPLVVIALAVVSLSAAVGTAAPAEAAVSASVSDCFLYYPTLYPGVQGQADCVAALQGFLRHANDNNGISIDGIFGPQTANHVLWYTASRPGLPSTEIVDGEVWADMIVWCAQNDFDVCNDKWNY